MPHPKINSATNEEPVSQKIVELDDVCLTLKGPAGKSDILKNISLSISSGERISLVGPSGSGKTTLLNVMAGLDEPTSGDILIQGSNMTAMDENALTEIRRTTIGFIFQSFGLLPLLSAFENVELPLRISGVDHNERL